MDEINIPDDDHLRLSELFPGKSFSVTSLGGKLWLKLGEQRNTRDDEGQWADWNGNPIPDWDYTHWETVASGKDMTLLMESAEEYHKVCNMSAEEFFEHVTGVKFPEEYKTIKFKPRMRP